MTVGRTLQRVVLPSTSDLEVLPLYVDVTSSPGAHPTLPTTSHVLGRRRILVPSGKTASFGTYFNAFPAAYWRQWTSVIEVELHIRMSGASTVTVFCSDASGTGRVVHQVETDRPDVIIELPLADFELGGWYWFDVRAGVDDVVLESAEWRSRQAPVDTPGLVTVAVTTMNRPAYVVKLLRDLGSESEVLEALDEVIVVDQGDKRVRNYEGFAEAAGGLGGRLRVLEQANLGGSGGFARGMSEVLTAGSSRYVLLMDDDVAIEPESVLRALTFADACRLPTVVGGHMFSLLQRTNLHTFGEVVRTQPYYDWFAADGVQKNHDFAVQGLVMTPWMHRRIDVDYNAWWMCLVPVQVLESIGLAAPFFIAWDDAEFGLRAGRAGYPTVSLPGVAIWHMPFTHKSDASDWKMYFSCRNRLISALLHLPELSGREAVWSNLRTQIRYLLSMQYAAVDLHLAALHDLLEGPDILHPTLGTKLSEVQAKRAVYPDAEICGIDDVPEVIPPQERKSGAGADPSRAIGAGRIARVLLRQLRPLPAQAKERPQALLPSSEAVWSSLADLDSVLVWTEDGAGVRFYRRDRALFLRLLLRTLRVHVRLLRNWSALAARYGQRWNELTSPQTWSGSLGVPQGRTPRHVEPDCEVSSWWDDAVPGPHH